MHQPMKGVKVVEVAQFTFTPSAGAVLADWGADVIKVEHAVTGDAQRGLRPSKGGAAVGSFRPLMEHSNRGKRSIGLALETSEGRAVLLDLCRDADVFLTNFLPDARHRLRLEVGDLREVNPAIIYVRGSGHGQRGPDANKGGYDACTFWSRMGNAWATTPVDSPQVISQPGAAFGDSMGGMTIAGGIAAALFARDRTGEASIVDVSLMSVGAWAFALSLGDASVSGKEQPPAPLSESLTVSPTNPLSGNFRTSDGRWLTFTMLQPSRYFADACTHLGLEELIEDDRFATPELIMANAAEAAKLVARAIAAKPYSYWVDHLQTMAGPWAPVQSPLEILEDPQMTANGYLLPVTDADNQPRSLVASPVQFDETSPQLTRAPQFAEHTDDILRGLGRSQDEIIQLKINGAVT
jgi:crotonobetainyl-CoA:carnitine CoA-transferase CaiB-like acyl-CoA transferase